MKFITQEYFYDKYPKLFRQKDLPMNQTCMCWGLECGPGWYPIINNLCKFIQFHVDNNNMPQVEFTQVKEKYGTLRLYHSGANEYLNGAISFVENLSHTICETCGDRGELREDGWMSTQCDQCFNKKEKI